MLKFFKNSVAKGKSSFPPTVENGGEQTIASQLPATVLDEIEFSEDDISLDITEHSSKLSMSLTETIECDKPLRYFREFMTSIFKNHILDCYFDVDKLIKNVSSVENTNKSNHIENHHDADDRPNGVIVDDAVKIFKRFVALESPHKLDMSDDLRSTIISSICQPEGMIELEVFKSLMRLVRNELEAYFEKYVHSIFHCKYQIDVLTGGPFKLEDFIFNQMALFYFMEYLEQENLRPLLEFVMAVISYREQIRTAADYNPEEAQKDAIILYDKYFSLQATSPLGFSTKIRLEIENNICIENGPSSECFRKPFLIALKVLRQHITSFCKSQLYYNYLTEMINSAETSWNSSKKHKKSASDCSSEISVGGKSCVSNRDVSCPSASNFNNQMRIDSKLLYNGDMLWHRKSEKGLCLGRVNSLGRFESTMEPDPEKKDGSVLKRVMNKIVSGDKDKEKEEMAWQVAHMIVKDITDVTMGISENHL